MVERLIFRNNVAGQLASPATSADTSLVLVAGQGANFPAPGPTEYAFLTLMFEEQFEVVRLTERTGDVLTVTRAQDGTLAQSYPTATVVELRIVRATMDAFLQRTEPLADIAGVVKLDGTSTMTGALNVHPPENAVDGLRIRAGGAPVWWAMSAYWDGATANSLILRTLDLALSAPVNVAEFSTSLALFRPAIQAIKDYRFRPADETPEYCAAFDLRAPEYANIYIHTFHIRGASAGLHFSSNAAVTPTPYFQMRLNNGDFLASGNLIAYASDVRLKQDFKVIDQPLEKLAQIGGYTFNWRDDTPQPFKGAGVGVLAQDVQRVFPGSVELAAFDRKKNDTSMSGQDYLAVKNDHALVALLIECVKALTSRVQELERRTHP